MIGILFKAVYIHEFVKVLSYLDVQFRDNWCGLHPMAYLWVKDNMGMEYLFIVPDSLPYKVPTLYKNQIECVCF